MPGSIDSLPLDPHLQYGALGLLGVVVFTGMWIVYYLARMLVQTMATLSAAMGSMRELLATTSATLEAMHAGLASAIGEARSSMLEIERDLRSCRCLYREDPERPPT